MKPSIRWVGLSYKKRKLDKLQVHLVFSQANHLHSRYLTADFERSNFSLSQCRFSEAPASLTAIPSLTSPIISTTPEQHNLAIGTGAIAAISIMIPLAVTGFAALLWMYLKKRWIFTSRAPSSIENQPTPKNTDSILSPVSASSPSTTHPTQDSPIEEESPTSECIELDAPPLCELPHNPRYELPGDDLNSYPELSESQTHPPLRRKFSWEHED
jgi:hypothetical protein